MKISKWVLGFIYAAGGLNLFAMTGVSAQEPPKTVQSQDNQIEVKDLIKDIKDIKKDKSKLSEIQAKLDNIKNLLIADLKALKEAEAAHNPSLIKAAKIMLESDRKIQHELRLKLIHQRHDLHKDVRDYRHDRRQIKHGK